jgi:trehalose/maltose transport system substrate-binding protein
MNRGNRNGRSRPGTVLFGIAAAGFGLLVAACGPGAGATPSAGTSAASAGVGKTAAASPPLTTPPDATVADAKKYSGTTVKFYGLSTGLPHQMDVALARQFTKDTGIKVDVIPMATSSSAAFTQENEILTSHSNAVDVMNVSNTDVPTFAPYLVNLQPTLGSEIGTFNAGLVQGDTVDGRVVAIPEFQDFGMLYYRTDLLKKYGFAHPPATWQQLTHMATVIQQGQRKTNKNFYGYVFEGNAYEGLTDNALEWIASSGGGTIISSSGKVTINNPQAKAALKLAQSWVGTISPRGVVSFQEEDARNAFDSGNAAFMRNWPYVYAASATSTVKGKFGVAPLPHGSAPGDHSVADAGGWQIAVNKYTAHQGAAIAFVRYMLSPAVQKWRAVQGSLVPSITSLAKNPAVVKALPFITVESQSTEIPGFSAVLKFNYNHGSADVYQGVNQILSGAPPSGVVPQIASELTTLLHSPGA